MAKVDFPYVVIEVEGGVAHVHDRSDVCVVIIDYDDRGRSDDPDAGIGVYYCWATEKLTQNEVLQLLGVDVED